MRYILPLCLLISLVLWSQTAKPQCSSCSYRGANLVLNGDFELGNLLFSSSYNYSSALTTVGNYYVGQNAQTYNPAFTGKDHTTGSGNFMMVNGNTTSGAAIWCQTVAVLPNTNYSFSAWVSSLVGSNPALLQFKINGVAVGSIFVAPGTVNTWQEVFVSWNSGLNLTANICITNQSIFPTGNDFGLDDISFTPCVNYNIFNKPSAGADIVVCGTVNAQIGSNPIANFNYQWSPSLGLSSTTSSNPTVTITNNGSEPVTYTYILQSDSLNLGCISRDTINITINPSLNFDIGDMALCDEVGTLTAPISGATYLWSTGDTTQQITAASSGKYWVRVSKFGCSYTDTINVEIDDMPVSNLPDTVSFCEGGLAVLSSSAVGLWNTGLTGMNIVVINGGQYWQTITNGACVVEDTVEVLELPYPVLDLGLDKVSCDGSPVLLDAQLQGVWQNGLLSSTFTAPVTGTYYIDVFNGPCMSTDTVSVLVKNVLPAQLSGPFTICEDSSITLSAPFNGSPQFLWSTGATSSTISISQPGSYWVTITDSLCVTSDTTTLITQPLPVGILTDQNFCENTTVTLAATSTVGASVSWSSGQSGNQITVAQPGNYIATISLGLCVLKDTAVVTMDLLPVLTLDDQEKICDGDDLQLSVNTLPGYDVSWSTGDTIASITVDQPGNYSVTVVNGSCTISDTTELLVLEMPDVTLPGTTAICEIDSILLASTSNPLFTHTWSNGVTGVSQYVSSPGTYVLTVTNDICTDTAQAVITADLLPVVAFGPDLVFCENTTGTLTATSTPGATVSWSTGASTNQITVSQAGVYTATILNGTCSLKDSCTVRLDTLPIGVAANLTFCENTSGTLTATSTPGTAVSWSTGANTNQITVTNPGQYIATITRGTCTIKDTSVIAVDSLPLLSLQNITKICEGDVATLSVPVLAGAAYSWSNGAITPTIAATLAGEYSVSVTRGTCTSKDTTQLQVLAIPAVSLPALTTICENDSVLFTSNSNPSYQHTWSTGATGTSLLVKQAGTYILSVLNDICLSTAQAVVITDLLPAVTLPEELVFCENGSGTLTATSTPGTSVSWSTGETTNQITVTQPGFYVAQLSKGTCTIKDSTEVRIDLAPALNLDTVKKICDGQSTTLSVSADPGSTILWSTGAATAGINVNQAGSYSVIVVKGTCISYDTTELKVLEVPTVSLPATITICEVDSALLNSNSNPLFAHSWSNGVNGLSQYVRQAGTYTLTVTNDICSSSAQVEVKADLLPIMTLPATLGLCENSSGILTATSTAGALISWSTGASTNQVTVNTAGDYIATVVSGACTQKDTTTVTVDPLPNTSVQDLVFCENTTGTLTATLTPEAAVSWSNGQNTNQITVNQPGNYVASITKGACTLKDTSVVTVDALPALALPAVTKICDGQNASLSVPSQPGYVVLWSTGASTPGISANQAGTYSVIVVNGTCTSLDTTVLQVLEVPLVDLPATVTICEVDSALLNGNSNPVFAHSWSNGATGVTQYVRQPGTYTLTVTNDICTSSDQTELKVDLLPIMTLPATLGLCENSNGVLTATSTPGALIGWSTGASTNQISVNTAGNYIATVINGACSLTDTTTVMVDPLPITTVQNLLFCENSSGTLTATSTPGTSVSWSNGQTTNQITVTQAGNYIATITNGTCTIKDTATVVIDQLPVVIMPSLQKVCEGQSAHLSVIAPPGSAILWSTGATGTAIDVDQPGEYSVDVTNGICNVKETTLLQVVEVPAIDLPASVTICEIDSVLLSSASNPLFIHNWSNGFSGTSQYVRTAGIYQLTIVNDICSASDQTEIKTDKLPVAAFGPELVFCENSTGLLTATTTPGVSVSWSTGANTNQITVSQPGQYIATMINGACNLKDTALVNVDLLPVSTVSDLVFCENTTGTLTATSTPGAGVSWSNGSAANTVTVNVSGNYVATITNGTCILKDTAVVQVDKLPVIAFGPELIFCENSTGTLTATSTPGAAVSWSTGTSANQITVNQAGDYVATVNKGTCTVVDTAVVKVDLLPVSAITDLVFCENTNGTLTGTSTPGAAVLWSNGAATNQITVSQAGNYIATLTKGTCLLKDTAVVTLDPLPVIAFARNLAFCEDTVAVLKGSSTAGTAILWSTGDTSNLLTVDQPGIYKATLSLKSCTISDSCLVTMDVVPALALNPAEKICQGQSQMLSAPVVPGYTYKWSSGPTTSSISVSQPGSYVVKVTNGTCVNADTTDLLVLEVPQVNLPAVTTICETDSLLLSSTSKPEFAHSWSNGFTGMSQYVSVPGIYTLTVVNDICTSSAQAELKTDKLPVSALVPELVFCEDSEGSLVATSTPGTSVLWSTGQITNQITVSEPGNYSAVVQNGKCSIEVMAAVRLDSLPQFQLPELVKFCEGSDSTIGVSLLNSNYAYLWSNGALTQKIKVSSPGDYVLEVKNGFCTSYDTSHVEVVQYPVFDLGASHTICAIDSLLLEGPVNPGYTYAWSTGATTPSVYLNKPGTYSLKATNEMCSTIRSTVLKNDSLPASLLADEFRFCQGKDVALLATKVVKHKVLWSTGATTGNIKVKEPGEYSVTITNGACTRFDTAEVIMDSLPLKIMPKNDKICTGDVYTMTPAYHPDYRYLWNNGDTANSISVSKGGTYTVKIINFTCQVTDTTKLQVLEVPSFDLPGDTSICETDSLLLVSKAKKTFQHTWSNGFQGTQQYVTEPGIYVLEVRNDICSRTDSTILTVDMLPVSILEDSVVFCEIATRPVVATSTGTAEVLWSTGATTNSIELDKAGIFLVTIKNGVCAIKDSVRAITDKQPQTDLPDLVKICEGSDTTLSVLLLPGATCSWNTGSTDTSITINESGLYQVTVINGTCTAIDFSTLNVLDIPDLDFADSTTICETDSLLLAGPSGTDYVFNWSNNFEGSQQWVNEPGLYHVTVINDICSASDTAFLANDKLPAFTAPQPARFCEGDSVRFSLGSNPNYVYSWDGKPVNFIWVFESGDHSYSVTNGKCQVTGMNTALMDTKPGFELEDKEICDGDTAVQEVMLPIDYVYTWSTGGSANRETFAKEGNYELLVVNGTCETRDDFHLTVNPLPIVEIFNEPRICSGDTLLIMAKEFEGYQYTWSDGTTVISDGSSIKVAEHTSEDMARTYFLNIKDAKGCMNTGSTNVTFLALPVLELGEDIGLCGDSVEIAVKGDYEHVWWLDGPQGPSRWAYADGLYNVVVQNGICRATDSVNVDLERMPVVELGPDTTICEGTALFLHTTDPGTWSTGEQGRGIFVNRAGIYGVTVSNRYCAVNDEITVDIENKPRYEFEDQKFCIGQVYTLPPLDPQYNYTWIRGTVEEDHRLSNPGYYEAEISNHCGTVIEGFTLEFEDCNYTLFIPNTFTPDGDGLNDIFQPVFHGLEDVQLTMYNRWGDIIYYERGKNPGWDGTLRGIYLEEDTYPYKVMATYKDPITGQRKFVEQAGKVQLLK